MKVEDWFKKGTKFDIKKSRYLKPPKLPYFLYTNEIEYKGADLSNNLAENNIVIERYSQTDNEKDKTDIKTVNDFLNIVFQGSSKTYKVRTEWLDLEKLYGTFWVLDPILEKIRKED